MATRTMQLFMAGKNRALFGGGLLLTIGIFALLICATFTLDYAGCSYDPILQNNICGPGKVEPNLGGSVELDVETSDLKPHAVLSDHDSQHSDQDEVIGDWTGQFSNKTIAEVVVNKGSFIETNITDIATTAVKISAITTAIREWPDPKNKRRSTRSPLEALQVDSTDDMAPSETLTDPGQSEVPEKGAETGSPLEALQVDSTDDMAPSEPLTDPGQSEIRDERHEPEHALTSDERIDQNSDRIDKNRRAIEDAIALSAAMPDSWLGDSENFAIAVGGGFTDGSSAIGGIGTFRINKNLSAYGGGSTLTDGGTWAAKGGIRLGW